MEDFDTLSRELEECKSVIKRSRELEELRRIKGRLERMLEEVKPRSNRQGIGNYTTSWRTHT